MIGRRSGRWLYMLFLIIAIMFIISGCNVSSEINDIFKPDIENAYEYKGLEFVSTDSDWIAFKPDNSQLRLLTNPAELANMNLPEIDVKQLNTYSKIYIAYIPKERVKVALNQFLSNAPISPPVVPACTDENELCAEMPIKTCEDAGNGIGIILFRETDETKVSFENDCLIIEGEELTKVVDKLILETL